MIVCTTNNVPGAEIAAVLGVARGNTIRTRHLGRDVMAGLKGLVGGEVESYTKLMAESREQAIARMIEHARGARRRRHSRHAAHDFRVDDHRRRDPCLRHRREAPPVTAGNADLRLASSAGGGRDA